MTDAIASVGAVAPVVIVGAARPPGSGEVPGRPEPAPPPMPALPKTEAANRQALQTEAAIASISMPIRFASSPRSSIRTAATCFSSCLPAIARMRRARNR